MGHTDPDKSENAPSATPVGEYAGERDMEKFWRVIRPRREPLQRKWFLPLLFILLAASVPWYWPKEQLGSLVAGMPYWVWITLGSSLGISVLAASMALWNWDDEEFETGEPEDRQ